ncbi:Alpha/Beta hydrolase protein [Emericellopsis atlantica]|uniref:Cutinase n=1 Tax=Emericellopsis atlantica TaxID=2614577 RepID=A0A9P7ZVF6_9HYPO|nr:Alpha/Beta hydrolase protein [Emericellopsis atlantica]KAG9258440.1 Alpha/Beta hydrolase protein [Emericellopsis atlantica]
MRFAQSLASASVLVSAATAQDPRSSANQPCDNVHIFLARGNNEPYPGRQGALVQAICSGLDNCDYEDIEFYNPLPAPYCQSVSEGAANGVKQITAYNKRCPDAKLVVSGYSQGGQVAGDVLGGGGGVLFEDCVQQDNVGLDADKAPGNKIVAAMIFGDVRHTAGQPYNVLSGADSEGIFPRPEDQLANLAKYGDALHNYCVVTDPICAGGDVVATHLNYFDVYSDDAAAWVQKRVAAAGGSDDEDATTTKASSTASKTATKTKATETSTSTSTDAEEETTSTAATSTVATNSSSKSDESTSADTASSTGAAESTTDSAGPEQTNDEGDLATGTRAHLATLAGACFGVVAFTLL